MNLQSWLFDKTKQQTPCYAIFRRLQSLLILLWLSLIASSELGAQTSALEIEQQTGQSSERSTQQLTPQSKQSNTADKSLQKVTLQLKWFHRFQFAGYYAAKQQGYFEDEGLDVEIKLQRLDISAVDGVLQGEADYGVSDASLLLERSKGKPVVLLKQVFQHSPLVLIAQRELANELPGSLRGKKLMIEPSNSDHAPVLSMLEESLGGLSTVEVVPYDFKTDQFINREIDAFVGHITTFPSQLKSKGVEHAVVNPRHYGIDFYGDNLFTSESEVQENPQRVEAMIRASIKGWQYALDNPAEIIQLILQKYDSQLAFPQLSHEARLTASLISADEIPLGTTVMKRYREIADAYRKSGFTYSDLDWSGFIYSLKHSVPNRERNLSESIPLLAEERKWLEQHPVIRVMSEPDYAPFDFIENNVSQGYSIDYVKLIAEKLGIQIEFVQGSFSELLEKLKNKEIDLAHSLFNVPKEREQFLHFTRGYKDSVNSIVTRKGEEVSDGLESMRGKTIAAVPGDAAYGLVTAQYSDITLLPVNDYEQALFAVAFGRADGVILELPVAHYLIQKLLLNNLSHASPFIRPEGTDYSYRLAVRKDWPEFVPILEKAMASISKEEIKRLDARWLDATESYSLELKNSIDDKQQLFARDELIAIGLVFFIGVVVAIFLFRFFTAPAKQTGNFQFSSALGKRVAIATNCLLILLAFGLGGWALNNIKLQVKSDTAESLQTVLLTTHEAMNIWVEDQQQKITELAANQQLRWLVEEQVESYQSTGQVDRGQSLQGIRNVFKDFTLRHEYAGFFVIADDGVSIASMRDENIGSVNLIHQHRPELLARAFEGQAVFVPPMVSDVAIPGSANIAASDKPPTMFFIAPIYNANDDVIAVLAQRQNPHYDFTRINQLGRMGNSGETYAFDYQGRLLSDSRFVHELVALGLLAPDEQSILSIRVSDPGPDSYSDNPLALNQESPLTYMAESAVRGESGFSTRGYRDYRGVKVYGAWLWDENLGFGLTTEIDEEEALSAYYSARLTLVTILGITVAVSIILTLLLLAMSNRANQSLIAARDQLEERVKQRTLDLAKSEQRLQLVIDNVPAVIFFKDPQGKYLLVNRAWEKVTDVPAVTAIGRTDERLFGELDSSVFKPTHLESLESKMRVQEEEVVQDASGEKRDFLITKVPVTDESDQVAGLLGVGLDISNRKRAEIELKKEKQKAEKALEDLAISEERFELALRGSNDGLWDWDYKTGETFYSARWRGMLGYPEEDLYSNIELWGELCHPDDAEKTFEYIQACVDGKQEEFSLEFRMRHQDGRWVPVLSCAYVARDQETGEVIRFVGTHTDLTQQKAAEKAILDAKHDTEKVLNRLSIQEYRYRTLVNHIPGAVFRCQLDEDWTMEYMSDYIESICGYPSTDFILNKVRSFTSIIHPQDILWADDAINDSIKKTGTFKTQFRIIDNQEQTHWVLTQGQIIKNEEGEVDYIDGFIMDITEQKIAEIERRETESRLQMVVDNVPAIVCLKNREGQYQLINEAFETHTGLSATEVIGRTDAEVFPENTALPFMQSDEEVMDSGQGVQLEEQAPHPDGTLHDYWASKIPITNDLDRVSGILGVSLDITERKKMEKQLLAAKDAAVEASRIKSEFLASMSHEIRTPMNGVLGMLGLLLNSQLTSDQRMKLNIAQNSAQSLLSILNDILDFSKVEAGKLELENIDFDLVQLISEITHSMGVKARERGIQLIIDSTEIAHSMVKGDPGRLRQILNNLVGNAIKFTHQGEIVIRAKLESENSHLRLYCQVEDTGIGIPEEKIDSLFEQFTQVDASTTRHYGGTGLGLAICKQLSEIMGGGIHVKSELGKGSCFDFNIRLESSKSSSPLAPKIDISPFHILILDDNQTSREVFFKNLKYWGGAVTSASSSEDALALCEASNGEVFDLIIVDLQDSLYARAFCQDFKEEFPHSKIKLLLMTELQDQEKELDSEQIGISGFITKPFTSFELLETVSEVLNDTPSEKATNQTCDDKLDEPEEVYQWPADFKILLVDDNEVNRIVAKEMLQQNGLGCEVAVNGRDAIDRLIESPTDNPFKLVLMDCQMPVLDGYHATARVRGGEAGERYHDVPILAMTAHTMQGDKEKCFAFGMYDYIPKPVEESFFIKTLRKWAKKIAKRKISRGVSAEALVSTEESNLIDLQKTEANKSETEPKQSSPRKPSLDKLTLPEQLVTIDFAKKKPSIANLPKAYLRALSVFVSQLDGAIVELQEAIESSDIDFIKRVAHSQKGTCGSLGMDTVYEIALAIESDIANTGKVNPEKLEKLKTLLGYAKKDANAILKSNDSLLSVEKGRDFNLVKQEIVALLSNSELIPVELIAEFKASGKDHFDNATLKKLVEQLETFDYDQVLETLQA
ncbi:PAS domain S-box protein [Aliikangiella marina]|uniref:Sensory/regulatory protein RpfC n=1 Tax=Aliikangiella marina TaxID=1712262 RepID=A0A545T7G4_9GAMM|nr:PAS domain S-box protein [Aliikangiella marina]TQV73170.1 PAS domain S-box protein [Aliikangiella marina]